MKDSIPAIRDIISCKSVWIELCEVALKDGKITMEEYLLIKNFTENLENYIEVLEIALSDGDISKDEEKKLFALRANMMQDAIETANDNNVVSPDEFTILHHINEFLEMVAKYSSP